MEYRYKVQRRRRARRARGFVTLFSLLIIAGCVFFAVRFLQGEAAPAPAPQISENSNPSVVEPEHPAAEEPPAANPVLDRIANIAVDLSCPFYEAAAPILVNRENFIPEGHDPDLVSIGDGFYLNRRAAAAWQAMRTAAAADGINLWVISAYRSHERQTYNFNNSVQNHIAAGRSPEEAHAMTAGYIAVPGTSEHTLGLAIDVNLIDNSFENTAEFAWLIENAAEFGYIFRYPRHATQITGINFEPWHFRYVGSNHARIITEMGIVLEEYVEMLATK